MFCRESEQIRPFLIEHRFGKGGELNKWAIKLDEANETNGKYWLCDKCYHKYLYCIKLIGEQKFDQLGIALFCSEFFILLAMQNRLQEDNKWD